MKILGIIPARYASTRFPGKPLVYIEGKTMIHRVYEQAMKSSLLDKIIVATDHYSIFEHVAEFGGNVIMTSDLHPSGTDRCNEVITKIPDSFDFVINIQGDEPFIHPKQIELLCNNLDKDTQIATLVKKIDTLAALYNINIPKVVFNESHEAIYFSRHPIPYLRGVDEDLWLAKHKYYKHIGIYAYRSDVLSEITKLKPSSLELAESLEQLRWIQNGYKIKAAITEFDSYGIDTPEDLEQLKYR
ncbi:MAG: 3-deoxy-manno-octulosonate cytidylyltransferase [Cytophagales bacterium]|nr:MAG: 3-deoxy-manno-octulosonate cytidylyltransferase [Cytophagales bacterium]